MEEIIMAVQATNLQFDYSKYGFRDEERYVFKSGKGLNEGVVRELSGMKGEPEWMLRRRLQALQIFNSKPVPLKGMWANEELAELDYDNIHYFVRAGDKPQTDWDAVPTEIKNTFEKLGIPEAERKFLAGVGAQYESEVVYHSLREEWQKLGVIFLVTDTGLKEYPEILKKYFGTIVPSADNKYAALNTAVWSGGSFVYVPKGVHVDIPLQAYFRINAENMGQFERTMIIVEEGSSVHYVEGCSAPIYTGDSLHSAVVEIVAKQGSNVRYSTIQNWSPNVYNLVTKRAKAEAEATVSWVDGNLGSKLTMKYPSVYLTGPKAHGEVLSVAYAGEGQHQDAGAKMIHAAPETTSLIESKSISKDSGRTTYRGLVRVDPGVKTLPMEYAIELSRLIELSMEGSVG